MPDSTSPPVAEIAKRGLNRLTHRVFTLPVIVLMPHSRCNCRCVMCDIWKANDEKRELSADDLARHVGVFAKLRVRRVVLSGGEALMHTSLWKLCALLKQRPVAITLLSTGLLLERHAQDVVRWCDDVIVSLDGPPAIHDEIRNVPRAFDRLARGVAALKALDPSFPVTARCVLQRRNFATLPRIVDAAHDLGLDRVSFLAADVSSQAFNRPRAWDDERVGDVSLSPGEAREFAMVVEETISSHGRDFASRFIAESPGKLRRLPRYYAALLGDGDFPANACTAPWYSAVVEADGAVRPCFFQPAFGNVHTEPLDRILGSPGAVEFRRRLDVRSDAICRRCVCSLNVGLRTVV